MMLLRCCSCCCRVCVVCRDRTQTGQDTLLPPHLFGQDERLQVLRVLFFFVLVAALWQTRLLCVCVSVCVGHVFLIGAIIIYYCCCHCYRHWCWAGEQVLIVRVEFAFGSPSLSSFTRSVSFGPLYFIFGVLPLVTRRWIELLQELLALKI